MRNLTRWSPIDEVFDFQREMDRVFNQFWNDLPARTASSSGSFQVNTTDEGWQIDVPLPGVDPQHVSLEVAGSTLHIRVNQSTGERNSNSAAARYEQTLTIPQFLDVDKLRASHRHGMLSLTLPLKESVKPRRIQIAHPEEDRKQLTTA